MKKQISILLVLLMILSISASAFADDTRVVTDVWGREVEIPAKVESIVCLGSGAPRMAAYLDVIGMMVGCEDHDKPASISCAITVIITPIRLKTFPQSEAAEEVELTTVMQKRLSTFSRM